MIMGTPITFDNNPNVEIKTVGPKTPEQKPAKKEYTAEEVEAMAQATMKAFGWEAPVKKETKALDKKEPDPEKAISTVENDPDKEKPKEDAPAKAAKKSAAKKEGPDMADRIAAKIGEENEKLISRLNPPKPQPEQRPQSDKTEKEIEDEHLAQVFSVMAQMSPSNATLPKQFASFLKKESEYQLEWEKENPRKEFDPTAKEHSDWYEENQPQYDERQFNRAQITLEANRIVQSQRAQEQAEQSAQAAKSNAESSIESATEALEEDTAKHLETILGENTVLESDGPISDKLHETSNALAEQIEAVTLLTTPGTQITFDPNNKVHIKVRDEVLEFDDLVASMDDDERRKMVTIALGKKSKLLNKRFVPRAEYQHLTEEQRRSTWNTCAEPALVSKRLAVKAKESLTGWLNTLFNQVGRKPAPSAASPATHKLESEPATAPNTGTDKPSPPSLSPGATGVTQQAGSNQKPANSWEAVAMTF